MCIRYLENKVFFYFVYRKEGLFVQSIQGSAVSEFEAKVKQAFKEHHEIANWWWHHTWRLVWGNIKTVVRNLQRVCFFFIKAITLDDYSKISKPEF